MTMAQTTSPGERKVNIITLIIYHNEGNGLRNVEQLFFFHFLMNFNHCAWLAITENWYNTLITIELTGYSINGGY